MSAQANIVAFDGAATPVTHTLVPIGAASDSKSGEMKAYWSEKLATVPDYAQIRVTTSKKRMSSGINRLAMVVEVPVMEAISGQNSAGYTAAPKVAYTNTYQLVEYCNERATVAEKRLARQLAINIAGSISTSVAAATTGPMPELFDLNISAS